MKIFFFSLHTFQRVYALCFWYWSKFWEIMSRVQTSRVRCIRFATSILRLMSIWLKQNSCCWIFLSEYTTNFNTMSTLYKCPGSWIWSTSSRINTASYFNPTYCALCKFIHSNFPTSIFVKIKKRRKRDASHVPSCLNVM